MAAIVVRTLRGPRHGTYGPSLPADQAGIAAQNLHHGRSA